MVAPRESPFTRVFEADNASFWAGAALLVALLGIATASILIVYAQSELGSNAITFNRLGLATLAFALWQGWDWFRDRHSLLPSLAPTPFGWKAVGLLVLAGTTFSASLIVWSWSMTETSVANATLLENMMPLFTTLGGWLFLGQRFSRQFLIGMGVAILGAIAIGLGDLQIPENNVIGDLAALLSALFASASLLSIEKLRNQWSTPWIMVWVCLIGAGFAFIPMVATENHWFPQSLVSGLAVLCLGIISQFLGQGLLTFCLTQFSSAFVAVALLAVPAIAALLAFVLLGETLTFVNGCAFVVVLAGIYWALSSPSTPHSSAEEKNQTVNCPLE